MRRDAGTASPITRKEARWNEILLAAGDLFFERGFEATTMQDIAERVGLLAGSLYYYIETKEDLLYELAKKVGSESLQYLDEGPAISTAAAPVRLCAFIERWMQRVHDAQPRAMYAAVERHRRSLSPERLNEVDEERRRLQDFVGSILRQGVAEGSFAPIPTDIALNNIIQLLWLTAFWFDPAGERTFDDITAWYKTFVLRGLGASAKSMRQLGLTDMDWQLPSDDSPTPRQRVRRLAVQDRSSKTDG